MEPMVAALVVGFSIAGVFGGMKFVVDRAWDSWSKTGMKGKEEKHIPGGKRLRSLKRLTWANLVGTAVTIAGLVPLINLGYSALRGHFETQNTLLQHTNQLKSLADQIATERKERLKTAAQQSDQQNRMDGKLDLLIELQKRG